MRVAADRRQAESAGNSAVVDQLRIRPGINGMLTFLLAQEARLIAARKQLPVGTSLLAVAQSSLMASDPGYRMLPWDSEFFGVRIAQIDASGLRGFSPRRVPELVSRAARRMRLPVR